MQKLEEKKSEKSTKVMTDIAEMPRDIWRQKKKDEKDREMSKTPSTDMI